MGSDAEETNALNTVNTTEKVIEVYCVVGGVNNVTLEKGCA